MKRIILSGFVLAALAGLGAAAWADLPARVGRLSFIEGPVSFAANGSDGWQAASLNYPISAGDRLSTGDSARAEAHVGSTAVRLASNSAVTFDALDERTLRVRLDDGAVSLRIRRLQPEERVEVDTRTTSVSLLDPGLYRIDQKDDGAAAVTVRWGGAQVTTGSSAFRVGYDQTADIPAGDPSAYRITAAAPLDSWDRWIASRDSREDNLESARYVSREMDGVEDLDQYGSWRIVAGFGPCWIPFVSVTGWAPYRFGHWVWIQPWGWTWIDDEPWGFAPFHYGRWVTISGTWAWVPGPLVARPVFHPALVGWVGGQPTRFHPPDGRVIRWVPLRPREPARPMIARAGPEPLQGRIVARPLYVRPGYARPEYVRPEYARPEYVHPAYASARPEGPVMRRPGPWPQAESPQGETQPGSGDPDIWKIRHRR